MKSKKKKTLKIVDSNFEKFRRNLHNNKKYYLSRQNTPRPQFTSKI